MKKNPFLDYLLLMVIITLVFGVVYATVQQSYRTGANDPQIQIARDINERIHKSRSVESFFADTVDIGQSLSGFVTLYRSDQKPICSSGYLDGKMPQLPSGIFDFAKTEGEHRVTWQPRSGVRMAMVIINSNSPRVGFVAAGRSLQEVEVREQNLVAIVFTGWILCMGVVLFHAVIQFYRARQNKI